MRRVILLFGIILIAASTAYPDEEDWHSVKVLEHDTLTIHIKVKKRVTMADKDWLCIEFENTREIPFNIKNANCRIESNRFSLKSKKKLSSGGLFSGNDFFLFPQAWDTTPVADRLIKKGTYRVSQQVCDSAACLLGLPPKEGLLVKARFYISIELAGGKRLETPRKEGVPFEFEWHYPDKAGFIAMKKRFKHILKNPIRWQFSRILRAFLDIPEMAKSVTVDELLDALGRRKNTPERQSLMVHINKHYPQDKKVIDFFLKRLKDEDWSITRSLCYDGKNIWHKDFIEPLVKIYENRQPITGKHYRINIWVSRVLYGHRGDWKDDKKIPGRLSAVLLKHCDFLTKRPEELEKDQMEGWASWARELSLTCDLNMVKYLVPYLDCKVQVCGKPSGLGVGERLPPLRACDTAMEAILRILDENIEEAYKEAGYEYNKVMKNFNSNYEEVSGRMNKIRDGMIQKVKKRLKED